MKGNYQHIFTPLTVKNMTIKNRITMMPMGTNYGEQNGEMSFLHINYYEQRAKGGTGLIIVENASVDSPQGSNRCVEETAALPSAVLPGSGSCFFFSIPGIAEEQQHTQGNRRFPPAIRLLSRQIPRIVSGLPAYLLSLIHISRICISSDMDIVIWKV